MYFLWNVDEMRDQERIYGIDPEDGTKRSKKTFPHCLLKLCSISEISGIQKNQPKSTALRFTMVVFRWP